MWGALSNETALAQLQLTNASVLELAVFYCDIMHDRETACRMAKAAFDDAVVEVRDLSVRQLVVLQGVAGVSRHVACSGGGLQRSNYHTRVDPQQPDELESRRR